MGTVDQSMLSFSLTLLFLLLVHNPANSFSPPSPSCTFSSYSSSFLLLLPALPFISSESDVRCPPCNRFNCETQDPKLCKWFGGFLQGGSKLEEMMSCAKGCSNGLPLDDCKFKVVKVCAETLRDNCESTRTEIENRRKKREFVETQERNVEGKPDERKVKSNGKRSIFFGSQIGNVQEWSRSVCRARGSLLSLWL